MLRSPPEDKKPDLSSPEFRQPQTINNNNTSSSNNNNPSNSVGGTPSSSVALGGSPRPPSRDSRGIKRPSDEPHDGNPSKHVRRGAN